MIAPAKPVMADTHVIAWYLQDELRLSNVAGEALDDATRAGDPILVSAASVVEMRYLLEKGTLTEDEYRSYLGVLESADQTFEVASLDLDAARAVERIPRVAIPDPFDRMIAATAVALGVPLVTADRKLRQLKALDTIW